MLSTEKGTEDQTTERGPKRRENHTKTDRTHKQADRDDPQKERPQDPTDPTDREQ